LTPPDGALMQQQSNYFDLNAMLNLYDSDGHLQLDKDKEAAKQYFLQHVNQNTVFFHTLKEKLDYLAEEGYYDPALLSIYSQSFIKELFQRAYSYKFRFRTFMGAYKFYTSYAMRTTDNNRYLERYEDRVAMNALLLADGVESEALDLVDEIITGRYQPATPTFISAGRLKTGMLISCYLVRVEDNMESIGRSINSALQLSKRGGGVALCLTNLREKGAPIKGIEGRSAGPIKVMKIYEDSFSYADQLGQRQGAGAIYISCHHPDVMDVLDTKRENADEKIRIKTLSIGVVITDTMMQLASKNHDMYLFSPYDIERVYGCPMTDISITEHYDEMVLDKRIKKTKINPRKLLTAIAEVQQESGYPYLMFEDTVNYSNPISGRVSMSNLCVAPETAVLTNEGNKPIISLAGKPTTIWNGFEWSTVIPQQTGENQRLLKVTFSDGNFVDCTEYHKWPIVDTGSRNKRVSFKRTHELHPGDELVRWNAPTLEGLIESPRDIRVVNVADEGRVSDTYCLNEPKNHTCIFNGVISSQCSEILQVSEQSILNEDLTYKEIGQDICCNLGSMNIAKVMDSGSIETTVKTAIRALTVVSRESDISCVPSIHKGNREMHAVGLGQMNLHGFLARECIHYGSPESLDFTNVYFSIVNFWSLRESCTLAQEYGQTFKGFEDSEYASGEYFNKYFCNVLEPVTDKVKDLFDYYKVEIPSLSQWRELARDVQAYGLYNAYRQAIAPTGSISYINDSTASIHPVTNRIEIRKEGKLGRIYYPAPYMDDSNMEYYKDAFEIGPNALIDVYAEATKHVDQGLSLTLFFPDTATTRDFNKAQIYAFKKKIKTLYYVRLRQKALAGTDVSNCVSCEV